VVGDTPAAFLLGDSLLDGGAFAFPAALPGWSLEIDALNGRTAAAGAAVAEARTVPDSAVVVELGTNDQSVSTFEANAERILASFRDVPLVLWQNVEGPPDLVPADEINATIETLAGRRPNVAIADWDGEVPEEYLFDGVHPDPAHADAMADLIAPLLQRWWNATTQPPACS
jgi:lysophospholipase L1-like esterase